MTCTNPSFRCFSPFLAHISAARNFSIPVLGAHISGAEFQYPDLTWKEMCGQMAHLVADSGNNKGQLGNLVEAICRDFRQHDEAELRKLVEWARQTKTRGANKEKPARPDTAILFPPTDTTRAGFLLNAMGCETLGGRTQYVNLPEVEMADGLRRRDGQPPAAGLPHHLVDAGGCT